MVAGARVHAIFGFCDIRNFTDSTEVLQTQVMLFVNQIAEITHSMVDKHGGSANKNIGDAFLLVWKFKNQEELMNEPQEGEIRKLSRENQNVADLAIFSFLKIIAKINKFTHILQYGKDPALNERMPGYKVKMGFGLHQGWAIEGAIGSIHKIDASYLSPNVNMASRLEAATKQYGVALLISG
jgi:class 3 adenylate cyclase